MSNIIYEGKFYNPERKQKFIDPYAPGTQKILERIFKVSYSVENDLGKDLCDFTREELKRLFYLYMAKTEYSSKANVTWVSKYNDWCIEEEYLDGLNPLDSVSTEWKEQFVNKSIKKYWTSEEIDKIVGKLVNYQDKATVLLPRFGCRGTGNAEILNLRKSDIDKKNNILNLTDADGSTRPITVSERCIEVCLRAENEDEYEKKNGKPSPDIRATRSNLVDNDFVIKSSNTRTEHLQEAEKNIVHRRLSNIAEMIGEPNFTPLNLIYSGMLAKANELYNITGKLEDEEYEMIFRQFNVDGDQSAYRLKNEFLNEETLFSIYPKN